MIPFVWKKKCIHNLIAYLSKDIQPEIKKFHNLCLVPNFDCIIAPHFMSQKEPV